MRSIWRAIFLVLAMVTPGTGCRKAASPAATISPKVETFDDERFSLVDIASQVGVDGVYENGREAGEYSILESLGGGVGLGDLDGDGWPDLVLPGGGKLGPGQMITGLPTNVWRNEGGKHFRPTAEFRIREPRTYTHGVAIGDFDSDGFADLLLTGYSGLQLFRNQGDGTFEDITLLAGLLDAAWSSSAAWGDLNHDGHLDLYIAHYVNWSWDNHPRCTASDPTIRDVCSPKDFEGLQDTVYFSDGAGAFREATQEAGLAPGGKGLGVLTADLDGDGSLDVYVANDTTPNFLYLNDGRGGLTEEGLRRGVAVDGTGTPNGSMGLALIDFNRDQRLDIWVTNFDNETFALYRSEGGGDYTYVSESTGVTNLGRLFVGFGTVAADLDLDGQEELVVTNGHVMYHPNSDSVQQQPLLLTVSPRSLIKAARFRDSGYFGSVHWGRGVATADFDLDGDADIGISHLTEPAALLRNDSPRRGQSLKVRLIGVESSRDPIGASVTLKCHHGYPDQVRAVVGGGSYLSQSDNRLIWAMPEDATDCQVEIRWPSGRRQTVIPDREGREEMTIIEPAD